MSIGPESKQRTVESTVQDEASDAVLTAAILDRVLRADHW
jgi:hypothetical protein